MTSAPPNPTAPSLLTPRQWGICALGCLVLAAAAFLTEPSILEAFDFVRMHELYQGYAGQALRSGRLPLWNPHVGLGRPFLADIETAVFYPPNLLFALLGPAGGFAATAALHLFIAVAGTTVLAARMGAARNLALAAAVVFVTGASVALSFQTGQVQYSIGVCWLPVVLALALSLQDRPSWRVAIWLTLAAALQLLAGHPQIVWITDVTAVVFLIFRRLARPLPATARAAAKDLLRFSAAVAFSCALAAVQLLPFIELVRQGNRQVSSLAFSSHYSMPPEAWVSWILPPGPDLRLTSVFCVYAGASALLAGVIGMTRLNDRNVRALLAVSAVAVLIAAGSSTPIFPVLHRWVPGLAQFRIHARMLVVVALVLPISGALWLSGDRAAVPGCSVLPSWSYRSACALLAVLAVTASIVCIRAHRPVQAGIVLVTACLIAAWPRVAVSALGRASTATALTLVTGVDLALALVALKQQYRAPELDERPERALAHELGRRGLLEAQLPPPRINSPLVREDAGMRYGWSSFQSYGSLALDRVWRYVHEVAGLPAPTLDNTYPDRSLFRRGPFLYGTMSLLLDWDPLRHVMVAADQPDPRAYLVSRVELVSDWHAALGRLVRGHDIRRSALIEAPVPELAGTLEQPRPGSVEFVRFAPERIELTVVSSDPALLVLKEAWYPGWTAEVNGRPARCQPANVWMRSVAVPAGTSRVVLRFRSTYLRLGGAISVASLILLTGAWLLLRARRRGGPAPQ